MAKIVLSVNSGSSSVKISAYSISELGAAPKLLAEVQISGLTAPPPKLTYSRNGDTVSKNKELSEPVKTQADAFELGLRTLIDDAALEELPSDAAVAIVAHRIVHGGDYDAPQLITQDTVHHLEQLSDLAPLHNAPALEIVRSVLGRLPGTVNVAHFDSLFHATLPEHVRTYPIDPAVARQNMLRKYGFHGLSYSFITRAAAGFLGKPPAETSLIALHLGSGASACAIRDGKSLDTSMGLTPLAGLPGATRSGSVDPSLVFHYTSDAGKLAPASTKHLHISQAEQILNKESGWRALAGTTDFGAISEAAHRADPDPRARLAFDLFVDRVCGFVGAYYVSLAGRVDALVFAGGIGEKGAALRAAVADRCACLGFAIDARANDEYAGGGGGGGNDVVVDIGKKVTGSGEVGEPRQKRVLVCATDEQFEMARSCAEDERLWK